MADESIQQQAPLVLQPAPTEDERYPLRDVSWEATQKDKNHLDTLAIFYFIFAGLRAFGGVVSLIYIPIGFFILGMGDVKRSGLPPEFGYFFIGLSICMTPMSLLLAFLQYHTGKSLRQRKRRTFIFSMAILDCVVGGVTGIVLAIFTMMVLSRESVKELFKRHEEEAQGL